MGIHNNITLRSLTENLRQFYHRKTSASNNISQDITRSHTRKLIRIAHEDQTGAVYDGLQQGIKKCNIHHGHFIYNDHICLQRILFIFFKSGIIPFCSSIQFQHPMDRPRLITGRFTHPFCRASRRSCQKNVHPLSIKIPDDCINRRCLTGSRATGYDGQTASCRFFDRL